MKKAVLALLLLTGLTKVANAQKGSILLYGNVGFTSSSATDTFTSKSSSYTISPGIGYQLSDNWTAGLNIAFGGTKQEVFPYQGNYNTSNFFNIGPFLRYSYPITSIFSVYGQLECVYLSGNSTPYQLVENKYTGFGADFFPAIGVGLKNGYALNFSFGGLSYQTLSHKTEGADNTSSNTFGFTFGQGASFGISKNFEKKKK